MLSSRELFPGGDVPDGEESRHGSLAVGEVVHDADDDHVGVARVVDEPANVPVLPSVDHQRGVVFVVLFRPKIPYVRP